MSTLKQSLKRIVGHDRIALLRSIVADVDLWLARACVATRKTSALYYLLFNARLHREMQAVMRGRLEFARRRREPGASSALLRRNIHRIEKGLIMKQRRSVFGLDYLASTVEAYEQLTLAGNENAAELCWAHDVLTKYFEVAGENSLITAARTRFESLPKRLDSGAVPHPRRNAPPLPFSYEDFYVLCRRRRSVRWFAPQPVDPAVVDKAILAAAQSPSACNRQPFRFHVFTEKLLVSKISSIPMGTKGFAAGFPAVAVVTGDLACFYHERDRHVVYIDGALAAMSFMFALETLGLASCSINWPDIESFEREMEKTLPLEPFERPIMLIAFGYPDPDGDVPFSAKKELAFLRTYNRAI